jgi:hypothetical protein
MIIRCYEDAPTYAWVIDGFSPDATHYSVRRIGVCSTDQAARAAVERALEQEVGS